MDKLNLLMEIPMFSKIDKKYYDVLLNESIIKKYHKGCSVHNETEECKTMDIIITGVLVSHATSENGDIMHLFEFKKNSIIGANLLFSKKNVYPYNIYAQKASQILMIKKETIEILLHDYCFVKQFISSLSENSQGLNDKIAMFSQKKLRDNILAYLKNQSVIQNTNSIILPITKKELADFMCVRRPSLFRELKKMQEEKLISINNREIILL